MSECDCTKHTHCPRCNGVQVEPLGNRQIFCLECGRRGEQSSSSSPDLGGLILRLIHELEYLADGKSETGMYAYVDDNGACYDAGGAVKKAIREALADWHD